MSRETQRRIRHILQNLDNLDAVRRLFAELNYDVTRQRLPRHGWPDRPAGALAADPEIIAAHDRFQVIYGRLAEDRLLITPERDVIEYLLRHGHEYALFLFSDRDQEHWHFVNVKYERQVTGTSEVPVTSEEPVTSGTRRRVFRRITVGPYERRHDRLRTPAERLALLDLATIDRDLAGISPLAIQQRHDDAFDVEKVTRDFFRDYRTVFEHAEASITGLDDEEELRLFTQKLFNRLMFIVFLERKGWLQFNGREDYLRALWEDHQTEKLDDPDYNFFRDRLTLLFFSGLNNKGEVNIVGIAEDGFLQSRIGRVPYLNGGLFEEDDLDRRPDVHVPDDVFYRALDELFYHYNFTVTESTPLDVEVAVDPEMLGRIFEELVTGRHESGSYYTPKPIVSFMGREALKGYLHTDCPQETETAVAAFVDERDPAALRNPEAVLGALRAVTICDPACGSGAYLVGMLHELLYLRQALFATRGLDPVTMYERKLEIIQNNLYGVDIDPFAVNIARLRLWLSLVVDFEGEQPEPLPNLDFKIEVGDSLTAPDPSGGLQPNLFRQQKIKEYFRLKGEYMETHGERKRVLREQIDELRAEISEWAHPKKKNSSKSQGDSFDWVVDFAEIFTSRNGKQGGFDIAVANPPYVRQELLESEYKQLLKANYPEVYWGTADLYVFFYGRALQLLKPSGMLSFISSNKFMRAYYGTKLRTHLQKDNAISVVIDFGDLPLFDATTYPAIVIVQKEKVSSTKPHQFLALTVDDLALVKHLTKGIENKAWLQPSASLRSEGWALVKPRVLDLLRKLRNSGKSLNEYAGDDFYYGIKTGYNRGFIISNTERQQLINADPRSREVIQPWLRGRHVKRWKPPTTDEFVIFIPRGTDIDKYPAVKQYLLQFKRDLKPKKSRDEEYGRKPGSYEWYETQDAVHHHQLFEQDKIVWPDIAKRCEFTLDTSGAYIDMTAFTITRSDFFLLGVLNSQVVQWMFQYISSSIQNDYLRFKRIYLNDIPIPQPALEQRQRVVELVAELLKHSTNETKVATLETELNEVVFDLYDLNDEEVSLIQQG